MASGNPSNERLSEMEKMKFPDNTDKRTASHTLLPFKSDKNVSCRTLIETILSGYECGRPCALDQPGVG